MRSLPLAGKLGLLGFVLCTLVVAGLSYTASLYAPIAQRSLDNAQAQTLAAASREAFEQWTIDDDQLNMYAGLVILLHSTHGKLTQTTIAQALDARRAVGPQLTAIARAATDQASENLLADIRAISHRTIAIWRTCCRWQTVVTSRQQCESRPSTTPQCRTP